MSSRRLRLLAALALLAIAGCSAPLPSTDLPPARFVSVRWVEQGAALMALSDAGADMMRLIRIDPETGTSTVVFEAHGRDVEAWSLSPDETMLATMLRPRAGYSSTACSRRKPIHRPMMRPPANACARLASNSRACRPEPPPRTRSERHMNIPISNARTGGQLLVDQLLIHGLDMAFCVPGESYLEVLDALFDARNRIKLINARHEAGAANMAEAYGKLTGKPGICLVTRGPGACHAAVGVHTAFQDSTPMILLIGQVGRDMMDREAFQEIDYRQMFGPVAKWAAQIDVTARIPEYIARAFHIATSGRPGPVVLALPEDMLTEVTQAGDAVCYQPTQPAPAPAAFAQIRELLDGAKKPMILAGGPGWSDRACAQLQGFAEANGLPVATSFRRQDTFDNRSSCFAGDLGTSGPPASQSEDESGNGVSALREQSVLKSASSGVANQSRKVHSSYVLVQLCVKDCLRGSRTSFNPNTSGDFTAHPFGLSRATGSPNHAPHGKIE